MIGYYSASKPSFTTLAQLRQTFANGKHSFLPRTQMSRRLFVGTTPRTTVSSAIIYKQCFTGATLLNHGFEKGNQWYLLASTAAPKAPKRSLLTRTARPKAAATLAIRLIERPTGAREQDPQWWIDALRASMREAFSAVTPRDVAALGISVQQHGLVVLDETWRSSVPPSSGTTPKPLRITKNYSAASEAEKPSSSALASCPSLAIRSPNFSYLGAAMQAIFAWSHSKGEPQSFTEIASCCVKFDSMQSVLPNPEATAGYRAAREVYAKVLHVFYGLTE